MIIAPCLIHACPRAVPTDMCADRLSHFTGDFAGATALVMLSLAGNSIVSVAAEEFSNLQAMQLDPDDFNPTNANGTAYRNSYGFGAPSRLCVSLY